MNFWRLLIDEPDLLAALECASTLWTFSFISTGYEPVNKLHKNMDLFD